MKIKKFFKLFWLKSCVSVKSFLEYLSVVYHYYPNPLFRSVDLYFHLKYLFKNPFRISKKHLIEKGEEALNVYGETYLTSFEKIVEECQITRDDTVYELGCGRGRVCFWLSCIVGCSVVGIDHVPKFITIANQIKKQFGLKKIEFFCQDILEVDFSKASVIYFYGTCSSDEFIQRLIGKLKTLPDKTLIITVSYSLLDYTNDPMFCLKKSFSIPFVWGKTEIFLHQIKK